MNKSLGKKFKNMLPTNDCMFYKRSETILRFGLPYLHHVENFLKNNQ